MGSSQQEEAAGTPAARRYQFGAAVFDEGRLELSVNGRRVDIERKPLEVLRYLLQHADQVVTRDRLLEACWPGRILSESVLSKALSKLREALGDKDQSLIKTVHGYGYRLAVSPVPQTAPTSPAVTAESRPAPATRSHAAQAERRQLTVLFCDLVGSTQLSQQLDPEDLRELVLAYQKAAAEVIGRYEGHIAQYLGDGLLVYFGHPTAHEDDAERAVRCGCEILAALKRPLPNPLPQAGEGGPQGRERVLSARIGIHTGNVVIGQMGGTGRTETLAMGDTTNIAARVQGLADPDTVVMSQATLKLVPGLFITRDLDEQALKGVDKPLCLYQVIQPSGVRSRLEAAEKLTPFVGREAELALLNDRWQQAQECLGQAVLITGEPGVGKSRLLLNLNAQLTDTAHTWLECRAFALTRNSAYHPVTELLNRGLSINEGDTQQTKLLRLEEALDRIGQDRAEAVPLLAPLLNLALPAKFAPSPYSPELKRKKTINLLNGWLLALAGQQPLILAVEDLHWADPSTIELLGNLIQRMPAHPILAVFTARPEFQPNWPLSPHLATLALPPLRSAESGALLDHLLEQRPLPNPVKDRIVKQANGVPLFLEEVTRALIESGQLIERDGRLELAGSLESPSIPATLQDALMARLDRLDEAKSIAQVCGVIGREIPYRLLHAVVDTDEAELQWHLKMLTDVQLLYQRGSPPDATYVFKHALIQDTAYHSLLKSTRQKLHGKIAHTLETGFNERAKSEPALLAEHFEKAGLIEPAVKYYKAAAKLSAARSALEDAIHFQEKALKLIALLPEASTRDRLEVGLVAALVPWLSLSRGYTHPSVRSALEHARALPAMAADPIAQANVLGFSFATHQFAGEYATAAGYSEELAELGRKMKMPAIEAQGHANAAGAYFGLGRIHDALNSADRALAIGDIESVQAFVRMTGHDPVTNANAVRGWALFLTGYPDAALVLGQEMLARARTLGLPIVSALAASFGPPLVLRWRRQANALLAACRAAAEVSDRYGYEDGRLLTSINTGIALCALNRHDEGTALLQQGLATREKKGALVMAEWDYAELAAASIAAGRTADAAAALARAFDLMEKHDARIWEAELHRLKGELLLAEITRHPDPLPQGEREKEAEACFNKALEVSRAQGAKSLELRAAMSLARLWQKQGRISEARDLLKPVYDWFTEGFDTPDLKDARAQLDEL